MEKNLFWSRNMQRGQLYDACWIMGNCVDIEKIVQAYSYYSLLPIRFYNSGRWEYREHYDLHSCGTYRDGFELCRSSDICSTLAHFAQMLWEKSAEELIVEYPDIEKISFGSQMSNGLYPIHFKYDVTELIYAHRRIMQKLIYDGFTVDEYLKVSYSEEGRRKIWHYSGVVGKSYNEMRDIIFRIPHGELPEIALAKNVSFSLAECEQYFRTFDEQMLLLGNQRRAYEHFSIKNSTLIHAAQKADKRKIRQLVKQGYSVNEIEPNGETVFSLLVNVLTDDHDLWERDKPILEFLIKNGADVNLIGATAIVNPLLLTAHVYRYEKLTQWLLEHGANPDVQIHYDDKWVYADDSYTIQDWIDVHNITVD